MARSARPLFALLLAACTTPEAAKLTEGPVSAPRRTWVQQKPVVIRHATLLPANDPAIEDGALVFAAGRIVALGKSGNVKSPDGAEELDARGKFVTPGLIDAHSHLGVYASPGSFSNDDGNEATAPVTAEVSAEHGFWPQDPGLRRAAMGGITSLLVLPGSANLIGGRGFPVKLHFGRSAAEMRFPGAPDALKMACGENPRRVYGKEKKAPQTRMGNVAGYRQAFAAAKDYMGKWEVWAKKHAHDEPPPPRDLKLETLADALSGRILVQNHCYRADEMQVMLDVADEFGFHIRAFHHALEAYKLRDVLAEKRVAVATWADWWGFKLEAWDGIPENAALVAEAKGIAVIHSDSADGIQRLNQEAAKAMWRARESGIEVKEEEALKWITLNAAWVMGVDDRTGSLEPGKMADLVLWDRHPFSFYARAERVWADGVVTYDAATGPAVPSDFEAGEPSLGPARLVARPAAPPKIAGEPLAKPLPVAAERCVAFTGVAIASDGKLAQGTVVVEGEKITAVADGARAPAGCREVSGAGRVLAPGLIEPWTQLGLVEVVQEESSSDVAPRGEAARKPVHAALRAADSVNPGSAAIPAARLGGVTSWLAVPQGGLVPGQAALVSADGVVRRASAALVVDLGSGGRDALQSTHGAALEAVRELLDDAREWAKRRADFEKNAMRPLAASRLDLEALQPALAGKLPVVIIAHRVPELRAALSLARDYGLRAILAGAEDAWRIAPELAAAKVPVLLKPSEDLPGSFDALGSRPDAAALLSAAGVKVLFSSFEEPHRVRTLGQEAGNAVAFGLPWADALKAVTANTADAFGLDAGRIAPGARADLVLWNGDPLEASSRPVGMWIGGRQAALGGRAGALLEKYRTLEKHP